MEHCLKCRGSLRHDREFPGLVCQRCGVVYYFNSPSTEVYRRVTKQRAPRGGWHHATKAAA